MNLNETKRRLTDICQRAVVTFPEPVGQKYVMDQQRLDELVEAAWASGRNEGQKYGVFEPTAGATV